MSYPDYINRCRVLELVKLTRERPDVSMPLAAELCGFGSTKSLYRAKRRFENDLRNIKKGNNEYEF